MTFIKIIKNRTVALEKLLKIQLRTHGLGQLVDALGSGAGFAHAKLH